MSTSTAISATSPDAAVSSAVTPSPTPQRNPLLTAPILPTLSKLALPNTIAMLAMALVAVAETVYVGWLGTPSLAGMALVFPMVMLQQMMSAGAMGGGVSSAVSRALGAGDEARAARLAWHAVIIGIIAGLTFTAVFLLGGTAIYQTLGGRGAALAQALAYSNVIFVASCSVWLANTFASILRGSGNMQVPSLSLLMVSLSQVIIGGSLGLGIGPFPRLGMPGIALGTAIAYSGGAAFQLWYLLSGRARVRLSLRSASFDSRMFADILKVGALACISPLQTVLTALIATRLVSGIGIEALAGYGIGSRLEFLLVPITFAIGVACVPMVGMAIGAGDVARARRVAWTGGIVSALIVGVIGLIVAVMPDLWAARFTTDLAVLTTTRIYFAWAGPSYFLFGAGLCLYFASQGAGKVLGPVIAGTLRLAIVMIGGWFIAGTEHASEHLFAVIGLGMAAYGLATVLAVYVTPWGRK